MKGKDVFGCLPTGFGKSACFLIFCKAFDLLLKRWYEYSHCNFTFDQFNEQPSLYLLLRGGSMGGLGGAKPTLNFWSHPF